MRTAGLRRLTAVALTVFVALAVHPVLAVADAGAAEITQPCRTVSGPPDGELQRLGIWMSTVASAIPPPQPGATASPERAVAPVIRLGAFDAVLRSLGAQAGSVGLDNARGTFYVRFSPGPLDAVAVHERFVRAVEQTVPPEHVDAITARLRVIAQAYPEAELRALQRALFERLRAERPDVRIGAGVGCRESDDVRVEIDLYQGASADGEAALQRIAAEYGDRVVVIRRAYGPPVPAIGLGPGPLPPAPPGPGVAAPALPRFSEVVVVRRRCGRRPTARIALAPAARTQYRGFRVGAATRRRTAVTVSLRRAVRVEVERADGRIVAGRVARCN